MLPGRVSTAKPGQRFGLYTTIERSHRTNGVTYWVCRCDCGTIRAVPLNNLRRGHSRSCGCRRADNLRSIATTHGMKGHQLYGVWTNMKTRCLNVKNKSYPRYGGRGVRICDRWLTDFPAFVADVGERPSELHSLDRIDNNGNYEPGNVRWATPAVQNANTRRAHLITWNGCTHPRAEWARHFKVSTGTVENYLKRHGCADVAFPLLAIRLNRPSV